MGLVPRQSWLRLLDLRVPHVSYAKVVKSCLDFPVGIDEVNQVADNFAADFATLKVEHGTSGLPSEIHGHDWAAQGQHSHITIPRAVGVVTTRTIPIIRSGVVTVATFGVRSPLGGLDVMRVEAGHYLVSIDGGLNQAWLIAALTYASSSSNRVASSKVYSRSADNGLVVEVWVYEISGSSPTLTDVDWSVVAHGTTAS